MYILLTIFFQYVHCKIEFSMYVLLYLHSDRTFHTTKKIFVQGYVESGYTSTRLLVRSTSKWGSVNDSPVQWRWNYKVLIFFWWRKVCFRKESFKNIILAKKISLQISEKYL